MTAGITYAIEARVPATSSAEVLMDTYESNGEDRTSHGLSLSGGTSLRFTLDASGRYFPRLHNQDPATYGTDVQYQLLIRAVQNSPGAAIVVAGRLRLDDPLQSNVHNMSNAAYHLFWRHGYTKERLYCLATDPSLDGDGDGESDVDDVPSDANLEYAITQWTADKVGPDRYLTVYLMDHGGHDCFYLDDPNGESLTPRELDGWLDELEAAVPSAKINVVVEASYAGSFIDPDETISKPGRVIIASTGAWQTAYASDEEAIFSDHFVAAPDQRQGLYAAFQTARSAVEVAHGDLQTPWLHDDGPGVANETEDGEESSARILLPSAPDLWISKTDGRAQARPGETLTDTLTIQNVGVQQATGVVISDTLPTKTSFIGVSDGANVDDGVVTWSSLALGVGFSVTRTVTARIGDSLPVAGKPALTNSTGVRRRCQRSGPRARE